MGKFKILKSIKKGFEKRKIVREIKKEVKLSKKDLTFEEHKEITELIERKDFAKLKEQGLIKKAIHLYLTRISKLKTGLANTKQAIYEQDRFASKVEYAKMPKENKKRIITNNWNEIYHKFKLERKGEVVVPTYEEFKAQLKKDLKNANKYNADYKNMVKTLKKHL